MSTENGVNKTQAEFSKLRAIFWPIHNFEAKKFLPMAFMMCAILFNYSLLRINKDTLVVTTCGAELISALKLWGVLPSAVLFMIVYSKMVNALEPRKIFHYIVSFFISFFLLFMFVLFPMSDTITLDLSSLIASVPSMKWTLSILQYWHISLFYIMSELWGSAMIGLMFWQFANSITPVYQAKRFYAMFGLIGNLGLISSGWLAQCVRNLDQIVATKVVIGSVVVSAVLIMIVYEWMQRNVLTDKALYNPEEMQKGKKPKKKEKLSFSESMKYIFSSRYIGLIAALVICYGISVNLVEGVWKALLRVQFPDPSDYRAFMGSLQLWTGVATIACMLIGANILRVFGWYVAAMLTPLVTLLTGGAFFLFGSMRETFAPFFASIGTTVLMASCMFGLVQNILAKSTKYSLFDSTKEMSYIPLDDELKTKGKAAVDVVGGRLGKSGGAVIQWALLLIPGAELATNLLPITGTIFALITALWCVAVYFLNKDFSKLNAEQNASKAESDKASA